MHRLHASVCLIKNSNKSKQELFLHKHSCHLPCMLSQPYFSPHRPNKPGHIRFRWRMGNSSASGHTHGSMKPKELGYVNNVTKNSLFLCSAYFWIHFFPTDKSLQGGGSITCSKATSLEKRFKCTVSLFQKKRKPINTRTTGEKRRVKEQHGCC